VNWCNEGGRERETVGKTALFSVTPCLLQNGILRKIPLCFQAPYDW
jgi:hypothetical protein